MGHICSKPQRNTPIFTPLVLSSAWLHSRARLFHPPHITTMSFTDIEYSDKYCDTTFEYRHVILPKPARLLSEREWRGLGVQQSRGWVHYEVHRPEPHILLFRRALGTDPTTGMPPASTPGQQAASKP